MNENQTPNPPFAALTPADLLFERAMQQPREAQFAFVEGEAGTDTDLAAEAMMLLEGFWNEQETVMLSQRKPGDSIGHFTLIHPVGEGGMGTVWLAEQTEPVRRKVALKVIKLGMDTKAVVDRFERERQILAQLTHPNIAQVFEAGATETGRPYFAMEYVDGEPIHLWCARTRASLDQRLELFATLCDALQHAHQRGVMHRDLKPSNILVSEDGALKVIDFGIARATQEDNPDASLFTQVDQVFGTPAYMSPEQALGDPTGIDNRTDVYSLGVVLFELLTGTTPFEPTRLKTHLSLQRILRDESPPRPSTTYSTQSDATRESIPFKLSARGDLDWIVLKALEKEPDRRYQSPSAFRDDILRFRNGSAVKAVSPTLCYRLRKFVKRNQLAVIAGTVVLCSLLAGLGISLRQTVRANDARAETEVALQQASDSLAKESAARAEATRSLASLCNSSGMIESRLGNHGRAALWFAESAKHATSDEETAAAHLRADSFRDPVVHLEVVVDTEQTGNNDIRWHPDSLAVAVGRGSGMRYFVYHRDGRPFLSEKYLAHVDWEPTGNLMLATVGAGARLFKFPSGEETWNIPDSRRAVFSPDRKWIGVVGGVPRLISRENGETRIFAADTECEYMRFSPSGQHLLLVSAEREVTLYAVDDLDDPLAVVGVRGKDSPPCGFIGRAGAAFYLSTGESIVVFETATGKEIERYGQTYVSSGIVASSPDGRYLAPRSMTLIDRNTGGRLSYPAVSSLADRCFHLEGTMLAGGGHDFSIALHSVPSGTLVTTLPSLAEVVYAVEFSPDGRWLASAEGTFLRLWMLEDQSLAARPPPILSKYPAVLASHPDHRAAVIHSGVHVEHIIDRTGRVDLRSGAATGPVIKPGGIVVSAAIGPDPSWAVIGVSDATLAEKELRMNSSSAGRVEFRNLETGKLLGKAIPVPGDPRSLDVHPEGNHVAVVLGDGQLLEIDAGTREVRQLSKPGIFFKPPSGILHNGRCRYSAEGRYLFACGFDHRFLAWDRQEERLAIPSRVEGIVFDFDRHESLLAVAEFGARNQIHFWDLDKTAAVRPPIQVGEWPLTVQFDPSGERLLVARRDQQAEIYHWRSGELTGPALPAEDEVFLARFIPERDWAFLIEKGGIARFFECATGHPLRPPVQLPTYPAEAVLRNNGEWLISGMGSFSFDPQRYLSPDTDRIETARTWAELDAGAAIHPSGGIHSISTADWLERWWSLRGKPTEAFELITPVGVRSRTADTDYLPATRLIDNSGLPDALDLRFVIHGDAASSTAWVTTNRFADYFQDNPEPPQLTFDLGESKDVTAMLMWGYYFFNFGNAVGNEAKRFDIAFSADGERYSEPETFTNDVPVAGRAATLGPFENPAAKTARFVRVAITDNHAPMSGGDRVGIGEVRFVPRAGSGEDEE